MRNRFAQWIATRTSVANRSFYVNPASHLFRQIPISGCRSVSPPLLRKYMLESANLLHVACFLCQIKRLTLGLFTAHHLWTIIGVHKTKALHLIGLSSTWHKTTFLWHFHQRDFHLFENCYIYSLIWWQYFLGRRLLPKSNGLRTKIQDWRTSLVLNAPWLNITTHFLWQSNLTELSLLAYLL